MIWSFYVCNVLRLIIINILVLCNLIWNQNCYLILKDNCEQIVLQIDMVKDSVIRRGPRRVSFTFRKVCEILVYDLFMYQTALF